MRRERKEELKRAKAEALKEFEQYSESSRNFFFNQLRHYPSPPFHVCSGSRDCDMVESEHSYLCKTYEDLVMAYVEFCNGDYEGPAWWNIEDPAYYQGEQYHSRDRIMEAYENGNGRSVIV